MTGGAADPRRDPLGDIRVIDEGVALRTARLVAPVRPSDAGEVAALRAAVRADMPAVDAAARGWSQLGAELPPTNCRVIGRSAWVEANLTALRGAFRPLHDKLTGNRAITSRVLGAQIGALFGLMSSKVLGQFVLPFGGPGGGQLVVVGPNLLDLADEHGALADDIRRTVLVHEVTHRLQFDGTPWLGEHLRSILDRYLSHARVDPAAIIGAAARLPDAIKAVRETGSIIPLVETVLTEEQVEALDDAQGLMSLLEGHGNAAMFSGADGVVADAEGVREALASRRGDVTSRILTAVAGLDLKRRQYAEGEEFVRSVLDEVGVEGLNLAFSDPANLPGATEVRDPRAWLVRVGAA